VDGVPSNAMCMVEVPSTRRTLSSMEVVQRRAPYNIMDER
jgi:hypothetical protein